MSTQAASTIFVGSSLDLNGLAAAAIADPLLADGDVGFYGHMDGVVSTFEDGTEQSLLSEWAGTGSGLVELSQPEPMAIMSVTIANTGTKAITVPVGQLVSSAGGVQFQICEMPRLAAGWSPGGTGDGTFGGYTIQPGQSVTLDAQALLDGPSGNLLANQVTQIAVPGAAVTASSLITAAPQWSAGTVTLVNKSGSSQIIYEGVVVTGSGGSYEIGVDPAVGGFVATDADSSSGYYVLAAGGTITVPIAATTTATAATANGIVLQEQAEDAGANSITGGGLPAGVVIAGSSAITTQGVTQAAGQEHVGALGSDTGFFSDAQAALFTTDQGYVPTEANVNTYNDYIWTAEDLANWKAYVDSARAVGILNLAPMLSEFETVDFATSDATATVRAAALYSGGIAFDMPSWFFLAREPAYQQSIEEEIRWATQNGLRSSVTLSPESGDDENFLADTEQVVAILRAAGALPTQFVVKDGGVTGTDAIYSTDPNSLNNVANWLSSLTLTPSNSESGLENRGTAARPDDLMTGVQQGETLVGPSVKQPFSVAQLFAESPNTQATLTVTLGNPALGRLLATTGLGSVSSNGAVFTASGSMADLTAALQSLGLVDAAGAAGSTILTTSVRDAAGTITGTTALVVDNTIILSGAPATATVSAPLVIDPSLSLATATAGRILTAVVTLSNPSLGSLWGTAGAIVAADGSSLTINGTASTLQAFLRQIEFMPAPSVSGSEVATVSVSDGTDTMSSSTAIAVAVATGLTAANVPVSVVASPFVANSPYADLLLGKTSSPDQVVQVMVTLSGGGVLSDPGVGAVSSDGLVFSFAGTFAQEQAALRALEVVVAPSATTTAQTLSFDLNGHVATTALDVVSTDTVFVGAVDATQGGYADAAVASPLLATGKVGLFTDYNGATSAAIAGSAAALAGTWSGTAAGVYGFGEATDVAQQAITVRNTGSGTLLIPVGALAQTASGVQFQVVQSTGGNAGWSAGGSGDGTLGVYGIAAGGSLTLTVEALAQGYVGNVAANAITTLPGIANASITASSAILLATEYASGTVTLTNTGSSAVTVNEGTLLTNSTGTYQIDNDPSAAYYSLRTTDSSNGIYYIPAGASTTITVSGVNAQSGMAATALTQILAQTTGAADTLASSTLPAGVVVTASSAIGVTGPTTAAQGATWGGWGPDTGILTQRGYGYFLPSQGVSPTEANTNIALSTNFTAADLVSWDGYVDTMRGLGVLNVAPTLTGSGILQDISHSDATAYLRSAALYGGGIDVDMTPSAILSQGASCMTALVDDIQWAAANGLRSTLTLRAYSDANFLGNTQTVLSALQAAGALPSQVVVVGSPTSSTIPSAELANSVAQYAASLNLTPSASESGLASTGTTGGSNGVGVDAIMTGVRTAETATGSAAISPYAGVQVFDETAGEQVTATAALTSTALGSLSTSGPGLVSADGSTVTVSGTASAVAAALAAIRYTPASGSTGTATLNLSVTDSHGAITGETTVSVDNPGQSLAVAALDASGTGSHVMANVALAASPSTTITVSTTAAEHDTLVATAGGVVSDGVFDVAGSADTDMAALSGLMASPGAGTTLASLQITVSGAPVSFTDDGEGDSITSGGGNLIQTGAGRTAVTAGLGDTVSAGSGSVSATGPQGFTFLGGSSAGDIVVGGAGGGSFTAGTGGGSLLVAGTGATVLRAAGSNDTLVGGGSTTLYAADGKESVLDANGGDTVVGAGGATIMGPASGAATILAQTGAETVAGAGGAMSVTGGSGSLVVDLGSGSASVTGGSGSDTVLAGAGGHYAIADGTGAELVELQHGVSTGAVLTLAGFVPGKDQIALGGYGTGAAQQLAATQSSSAGGTVLTLPDGATITLSGIAHLASSSITSF